MPYAAAWAVFAHVCGFPFIVMTRKARGGLHTGEGEEKERQIIGAWSMCGSAALSHKPGTRCLEKMQALKSRSSVAWRTSFHPLPAASVRNERLDFCHLYPLLSILILTFASYSSNKFIRDCAMGCHSLPAARDRQSAWQKMCREMPAHPPSSVILLQPSFVQHTGFSAPVQAVFSEAGEI